MAEHVFFDLDGTLTDPKQGITRCIQFALEQMGEVVPQMQDLLWCIGPPLRGSFVQLVGAVRADQAVDLYRQRFAEVGLFENTPYPGIHDTLAALVAQGVVLHVASSKPLVFVEQILQRFELADYFSDVYGSELDGRRTDKGELLNYALARSAIRSAQAMMVGDRKHDALGAAANQMAFVGVLYGYGDRAEFAEVGAQTLVETHPQLLGLLT